MRVLDEIIVRLVPVKLGDDYVKCFFKAKVAGGKEYDYTNMFPTDDFESRFHRFMRIAEESILIIIKKESAGNDHATNERKAIPSP